MYELLGYTGLLKLFIGAGVIGLLVSVALTALVGGGRSIFDRGPTVIINYGDGSVQPYGKPKWSLLRWWLLFAGILVGPWLLAVVVLTAYQAARWVAWYAVTDPVVVIVPVVLLGMGLLAWWLVRDSRRRAVTDRRVEAYRSAVTAVSPASPVQATPTPAVWSAPGREEWTQHDGLS